jgi:Outer membrane receptor proteins, mostly Fe transport
MEKKILSLFAFIYLTFSGAFAENSFTGIITGLIVNDANNKPIELANITICSKTDTTKNIRTTTGVDGKFTVTHVAPGSYSVTYSARGFNSKQTPVFIIDAQHPEKNIGTKDLEPRDKELQEVTVTRKRASFVNAIDKKVFYPANDLISKSGSVTDLLKNLPSITVDVEGDINLRGADAMVLINGKPSAMLKLNQADALQQIPANSIEKIEVITNPSAKYKPDGTAGIINIVLKKNKTLGFNGSLTANYGTDNRYNANLSGNLNTGKFNFYGGYGFRQDDRNRFNTDWRRKTDSLNVVSYTDIHANDKSRPVSHLFNAGIDYHLNDKNEFGISGNYNYRSFKRAEVTNTLFEDSNHITTKNFDRDRIDYETQKSLELAANYKHIFSKEGHELNIDYTTSISDELEDNHYTNIAYFPQYPTNYDNTRIKQYDRESQLSVQYTNPLTEKSKLEAGYLLETMNNDMDYLGESLNATTNLWEKDLTVSNRFIYTQNIHVLYGTYEREFGKLSVLGGLRAELASLKGNQVTTDSITTNNYFRLYPTLHLSYKLSEPSELQLNYSHRIRRPEGDEMNPFPEYQNPYSLRVGNPTLKPEDIHSVEFGYQYKKEESSFISTLYYRYKYNSVTSVTRYLNDSVMVTRNENLSKNNSLGLELIFSSTLANIINFNLSTNTFYNTIDASNLGYSANKSTISWSANFTANANLTKTTMLQVSSNYQAQSLTPQGRRLPTFVCNMGLKQDLFNKKASAFLTISDLFNTLQNSYIIDTPALYDKIVRKRMARMVYLGFSYNFGNQKKKDNVIKYDNQL